MKPCQEHPFVNRLGPLLANIGRLHSRRADHFMEHLGLYRGQAFLLMILSHHDGLAHNEIAEKLEISPAAATKVIKRMEALQYVQRVPDPSDERVSRVYIQDAGRDRIRQVRQAFEEINAVLVDGLSDDEQKTLISLLQKVYASLLAYEGENRTIPAPGEPADSQLSIGGVV